MLKKELYQDIITEVTAQLAQKIFDEENCLVQRATAIDKDIQGIVQEIGRQTTQRVLEKTRDAIVIEKKLPG